MFLGPNNYGPVTSIAGGIDSRSSSTEDSSSCGSSCNRGDIGADDVVGTGVIGERDKSCHFEPKSRTERLDFCVSSSTSGPSYKLPTTTETHGGAFVAAGDEQAGLELDLTDLHIRPSNQQQQSFSYSGAAAAARRQRPLIMHHSTNIYEEEGEFDVLSEYSSSSSSAGETLNSDNFFFGDDDFEEREESCIRHIPRLGEWRAMQDSTTPATQQDEVGADSRESTSGGGSPRQRTLTSGGLNSVHKEDEAESVNIARHAAIGTLGVRCVWWRMVFDRWMKTRCVLLCVLQR